MPGSMSARAYGKIDADHQAQLQARKQARKRLIIIIACSVLLIAAVVAVTVTVVVSKKNSNNNNNGDSTPSTTQLSSGLSAIQTACNATAYPDACLASLSNNSQALSANPLQLVIIAGELALQGLQEAYNLSLSLASRASSPLEQAAIEDCSELLDVSIDELNEAIQGLESLNLKSLSKALKNVEIVISTASSLQAGCTEGLSEVNGTAASQLTQKQVEVNKLIINALGLVQALASLGSNLTSWKKSLPTDSLPFGLHFRRRLLSLEESATEYPHWVSPASRRILQSSTNTSVIYDAVVGPGENFTKIKQALANVPDSSSYPRGERYVIYVRAGTYNEGPLNISKSLVNITLLGEGCGKTIIQGDASVSGSNNVLNGLSVTTYRSATLGIVAKGFIAKGITFANTAGPEGHQAVALRSSADYFVFQECCFEGYQDTLYAHSGRQFYRDCKITGTVDFLFGDSLGIFQNCELQARKPSAGQQNTYTAQGKKEKDTVTGFSLQNCTLTAASDLNVSFAKTYLGRPWKTYSTTVFLKSNIGGHVDGAGWLSWNTSYPFQTTCVYGEYANTGAGSNTSQRVGWSCVNSKMSASQAAGFSVSALLPDTSFIPSTVPLDTNI